MAKTYKTNEMIGYVRVSTPRQGKEGIGLDAQTLSLKSFADQRGKVVREIYEDQESGYGAESLQRRDGLQAAIKRATELGVPILFPSTSRLSRDRSSVDLLEQSGVELWSVEKGGRLSKKELRSGIERAQFEAEEIQKRSKEGLARAKARGTVMGNKTNLPAAQRMGSVANAVRADKKVQDLADFLEMNPHADKMPRQELVDLLNNFAPWNVVSERKSILKPWTLSSLKKPLSKAREELIFRRAMENEDLNLLQVADADVHGTEPDSEDQQQTDRSASNDIAESAVPEDHEGYRNNPNYNRF